MDNLSKKQKRDALRKAYQIKEGGSITIPKDGASPELKQANKDKKPAAD